MPRYNISPSARSQAERDPDAFIDAETEALMMGLEALFPSMPIELVGEMAERHKECHALFERRERADTIVKKAYRERRGPCWRPWRISSGRPRRTAIHACCPACTSGGRGCWRTADGHPGS